MIKETLLKIGAISEPNIVVYAPKTRDKENLAVYRDTVTGVIFIDNYYVGNEVYEAGDYRRDLSAPSNKRHFDFEDDTDNKRRAEKFRAIFCGKRLLDFGCGKGTFLRLVKDSTALSVGIELESGFRKQLCKDGIECYSSLSSADANFEVVTLFHCLEHLPVPLETLGEIRSHMVPGGRVIIEVPHAGDFLLSVLNLDKFKDFTLWSQHLILHTRESLKSLLLNSGFKNVVVTGVQRYPISNHLEWLKNGRPGGHRSALSILDTPEMKASYESSLAQIDATDTLVAVAES